MGRNYLREMSSDHFHMWLGTYQWGSNKMFLLILSCFISMILMQAVLFHSLVDVGVTVDMSAFEKIRREYGYERGSKNLGVANISTKKFNGTRVMVRQKSTWHWGEIVSIDDGITIILSDGNKTPFMIDIKDMKTQLEASSWLVSLYLNSVKRTIIKSELPSSDKCGYKPYFPFSWINGAPRSLSETKRSHSRVMARRVTDGKWYWAKIRENRKQCIVQFENNGEINVINKTDVLSELDASSWLMELYFNTSEIVVTSQDLDQLSQQGNDSILEQGKSDFNKLWIGGVSKHPKTSFVISVCYDDLGWLLDFASAYEIHKITLITKCGLMWDKNTLPNDVTVIQLPNVGGHDHSYAYYLAHLRERSMRNDEVIFFLKGDVGLRQPSHSMLLDRMMRVVDERGFACLEEPPSGMSIFGETVMHSTFTISNYSELKIDNNELFKSPLYNTLGDYAKALNISFYMPLIPVCHGGNFAARSSQISKWPHVFWVKVENILSRAENIEEAHFQERLWAGILTEAMSTEESQTILNNAKVTNSLEDNGGHVGMLTKESEKNSLAYAVDRSSTFITKKDPPKTNVDNSTEGDARIKIFYTLYAKHNEELYQKEKLASVQMSLLRPEHELYHVNSFGKPISLSKNATIYTRYEGEVSAFETLHSLWQHCRNHTNDKVIYLHTHTAGIYKKIAAMASRGALSNECATLPYSCNVCSTRMLPLPHPQSTYNMWLARCDYVARLIDPLDFRHSMNKVVQKAFCRGNGKYAVEHWIHSHPSAFPCDLHPDENFMHKESGQKNIDLLSKDFKIDLQPAPRFHLTTYRKEGLCPNHGENPEERIDEYIKLYSERPYSNWWGWRLFNDTYAIQKKAISNHPSIIDQVQADSPTDYDMLLVGSVSKYASISLVISFCNENMNWLSGFAGEYKINKVTILSKCGLTWKNDTLPDGVTFIELPNVGRCDHSYAYWMANIYEPPKGNDEVVFFFKDNIGVRRPARARPIDSMIRIVQEIGFSCFEEPEEGFSVFHDTSTLNTFELSGYSRLDRDSEESFKNPLYTTFYDYHMAMDLRLPTPLTPVCYGGNFAVRSSQISKRSNNFWRNIAHALSRADNIEEGHFQERSWAGILTEPIDVEVVRSLYREGKVGQKPPLSGVLSRETPSDNVKIVAEVRPVTKAIYNLFLNLPTIGNRTERGDLSSGDFERGDEIDARIPIFFNINVPSTTHIGLIKKTITNQMSLLRPYHVIYHVDSIGIKFSLPDTISYRHYTHQKYSEEPTLQSLWQYCRNNPTDQVIYLRADSTDDYLTYSNIFASGALSSSCASVPANCNVCGTRTIPIPHPQISGNMWWARCEYVRELMDPVVLGYMMAKVAPKKGHCRGVGRSAASHWIQSHPGVQPCDLHPSEKFLLNQDVRALSSMEYEEEVKAAPRFELFLYPEKTDNCRNGDHIEERVDEYNALYDILPPKSWWGYSFFDTPFKETNTTYEKTVSTFSNSFDWGQ